MPGSSEISYHLFAGGIEDLGDGSYQASYTAHAAGDVQLAVSLHKGSARSVFKATCLPAAVAASKCDVQHSAAPVTAGQPGLLRFWAADRFVSRLVPWL